MTTTTPAQTEAIASQLLEAMAHRDQQDAFDDASMVHEAAERLLREARALHRACDCDETAEIVLRVSRLELRLHKQKNAALRDWRENNG